MQDNYTKTKEKDARTLIALMYRTKKYQYLFYKVIFFYFEDGTILKS